MTNTVLYSYAVSLTFLIVVLLSPLLSGVADTGGRRLLFLKLFTYLGAFSTADLFWFKGYNVEYVVIMSCLAGIGYSGSLVFYNSFLPEITTSDNFDRLSAKGYAYGYVGNVILLLTSFWLIELYELIGFANKSSAVRFSFLLLGVWCREIAFRF